MSQINSLLESSASGWKNMQSDAARLASKWQKTGLLEGLDNEIHTNNMSMILENQAKQLVVEASTTNQGGATFTAGQGAQWAGVALPLVRKVFGQIAAKEFLSVQPMNLPSGLVFFLDFQYGQDKEIDFGPAGDVYQATASMYGGTNPGASSDPTGGLYGAGRFGYSVNQFSASIGITVTTSSWSDVDYKADLSSSISSEEFTTVMVSGSQLTRPDYKGARAFLLVSGSDVSTYWQPSVDKLLPEYTRVDSSNNIYFVYTGSVASTAIPEQRGNNIVFWNMQPTDNYRGDFEDASGAGYPNAESDATCCAGDKLAIPSIDVKMKSEAIVAKTRKLKAQWTPEFAQDLNAYQALDAEAELTSIMSEYISLEIDLELLDMLIQDASAWDEYWNVQNNQQLNSGKTGYTDLGFYNTQGQWFQTLGTKMQKVSNKIHQKTLRGGANFIVISPTVATIIESIPGFASNSDGDASKTKFAFGIQKMGQMNSRYDVYKNPYMTENVILMGYRGNQFLETGAVFAPYIPLIMTPLVYDPDTFTPRKGLLTRYAKKMIRPEFYGRVFVSNTNLI
jgi:hypothetical protein